MTKKPATRTKAATRNQTATRTKKPATRKKTKQPPRDRVPDKLAVLATAPDAESRYEAARWLGDHGDARALVPLEHALLHDEGQFTTEGAFVDPIVSVGEAAQDALRDLYRRVELSTDDEQRLRALFSYRDETQRDDRTVYVFSALGKKARPLLEAALHDPDPLARLRAHLVLGWLDARPPGHIWTLGDEAVRYEWTRRELGHNAVRTAMAHFPDEMSPRVRRGIAELWLRYEKRSGGSLHERELIALLSDADPRVRACAIELASDRGRLRYIYPTTRIDELLEKARATG